jgi:hypothetical protein
MSPTTFLRASLAAFSLVLSLVATGCFPTASKAYLRDEDLAILSPDTKGSCIVAAQLFPGALGEMQGGVKLASTGGELVTGGKSGSLFSGSTDGFAFVNVPKGPFRVSYLNFFHHTGKGGVAVSEFNLLHDGRNFINNHGVGDVPNEMSGTCNGGFIWLGVFKGDEGGMFSHPKLKQGSDTVSAGYAIRDLKKKLEGTPWAAEIDAPAESKPLPEGEVVVEKVDPAKVAAAKAAAQAAGDAAVAKMMAQSRPVTLPPSDAGAVAAAAGVYSLAAINGKPVPYTFEANKCVMNDAQYELKADGAYVTAANMECAGAKYSFPTSGLFGIQGGAVTFAVGVGPVPAAGSQSHKLEGGTLTTVVAGADTYTYKLRAR